VKKALKFTGGVGLGLTSQKNICDGLITLRAKRRTIGSKAQSVMKNALNVPFGKPEACSGILML
jgi:hypothetical protein